MSAYRKEDRVLFWVKKQQKGTIFLGNQVARELNLTCAEAGRQLSRFRQYGLLEYNHGQWVKA